MSFAANDPLASRALQRVGTVLCGRYRLVRLIGIGGMGAVYAGTHRNGHAVAVKVLHDRLSTDPEVERLFRREAQIANTINHAGVVGVMDDDVASDGCVFLVMPLLDGETLRARWERQEKRVSVDETVAVANALLEVLAVAHSKKIVHRDIKPENIFISTDGSVRVLDFGIARFFETNDPASATRSGRAVGTPAFMAPEQALGRLREVDGQTDLWAVGATMFSLLSGRYVHDGETGSEIVVHAATRPARPLAAVAPHVPVALAQVVDRALSFEKSKRWADAATMNRALRQAYAAAAGETAAMPGIAAAPARGIDEGGVHGLATQERFPTPLAAGRAANRVAGTERLGGSPTRTTTAAVLGSASSATSGRSRRAVRASVAVGGLALLGLATAALVRPRLTAQNQASSSVTLPNESRGGESRSSNDGELLAAGSADDPTVLADYRAGIQLWLDASTVQARQKFAAVTRIAPKFAPAHLWYTIAAMRTGGDVREHYAAATTYRDALTNVQRDVLEAIGPSMSDPPDLTAMTSRLRRLAEQHPQDAHLALVFAASQYRSGAFSEAAAPLDRLLGQPHPPPLAMDFRARILSSQNDLAGARTSFHECIDSSPTAGDCLQTLVMIEANEGECAALEPLCRKFITRQPTATYPYACMADALFSTEAPWSAVHAALAERYRRLAPESAERIPAADAVDIAIAQGRLSDADNLAVELQRLTPSNAGTGYTRILTYLSRVELNIELGRGRLARQLAQESAAESRSMPQGDNVNVDALALYMRTVAGDIGAEEHHAIRQQLLNRAERSPGPPGHQWYDAYLLTTSSVQDAVEAVATMPPFISSLDEDNAFDDLLIGRVLLLAGRVTNARDRFARASKSCGIENDLYRTRAILELAKLTEADPRTACSLYERVREHWKGSPTSQSVRFATRRFVALACSATPSLK